MSNTTETSAEHPLLTVGQRVKVYSKRWTPDGWQSCEDLATVVQPRVADDDLVYAGDVEIRIDGVLSRAFVSRESVEPVAGYRTVNCPVLVDAICDLDVVARAMRKLALPPHCFAAADRIDRAQKSIAMAQVYLAQALTLGVDPIMDHAPLTVTVIEQRS